MYKVLTAHIIYLIFTLIPLTVAAQSSQTSVMEFVVDTSCTVQLDTFTIIPSSISFPSTLSTEIIENYLPFGFTMKASACMDLLGDTLTIHYKTFGFDLSAPYRSRSTIIMDQKEKPIQLITLREDVDDTDRLFSSDQLRTNGSFSRGFSIGNRQDLLLNSQFNLSLSGDIGDDIQVLAAISDDNLPIQPEGNTQIIQDFDRVFIKISKDSTSLTAGDYSLQRPPSYFMNYAKKLKGLSVSHIQPLGADKNLSGKGSFAISRGKFARQTLRITEGNFGPYRLTGNNNERFLIVLSGTEKVYRDGQLLTRGYNHDYVIDYNRAEITFMPTRMMNREDRIVVEYEYRDQNYLRTLYAATTSFQSGRLDANINFYSEQDSKNALGDLMLDSLDRQKLATIGDNLDEAYISGIRAIDDTLGINNINTYELIPNPNPTGPSQILRFSVDRTRTLYRAVFTEVGVGKGTYAIDSDNIVNGRVYTYVGEGQGKYDPIIQLVPPERKSMLTLNSNYRLNSNTHIKGEMALSNRDYNLFSQLDNDDNIGLAGLMELDHIMNFDSSREHNLHTMLRIEQLGNHFNPLNPYRKVEFSRDWNFDNVDQQSERLSTGQVNYNNPHFGTIGYRLSSYIVEDVYDGLQHNLESTVELLGTQLRSNIRYLTSEDTTVNTTFFRPNVSLQRSLGFDITASATFDAEYNRIKHTSNPDTLLAQSLGYESYKLRLKRAVGRGFSFSLSAQDRRDLFPMTDHLTTGLHSRSYEGEVSFTGASQQFSLSVGTRSLIVEEPELAPPATQDERNIIGRLIYNLNLFNDGFRWQSSFQTNAGQDPKIEYVYEKVEKGQGSYIYIGNQDSVLINGNFRYAPELGTAEYIRISLFNNEFITTQNQEFSQSLDIDLKRWLESDDGRYDFLRRFSTSNNLRITRKTSDTQNSPWNSLNLFEIDTSIVTYNSAINNILFFNKGERAGDIKIGHQLLKNIYTQINGREDRTQHKYYLEGRLNYRRKADILLNTSYGIKKYDSQVFQNRRFIIDISAINPKISIRPNSSWRLETGYRYVNSKQRILLEEQATSHAWESALSYRRNAASLFNLNFSFVDVAYNGAANTILEFEILEGLKDGRNFIWDINVTQRLQQNLELNITYQGRKNGENRPVHIGRAQFRATF